MGLVSGVKCDDCGEVSELIEHSPQKWLKVWAVEDMGWHVGKYFTHCPKCKAKREENANMFRRRKHEHI